MNLTTKMLGKEFSLERGQLQMLEGELSFEMLDVSML